MFQIFRDGDKCLLVIKEVLTEDSGIFTCRATNAAGVAECAAELIVGGLMSAVCVTQTVFRILISV